MNAVREVRPWCSGVPGDYRYHEEDGWPAYDFSEVLDVTIVIEDC